MTENTIKLVTHSATGNALHVAIHVNSEKDSGMLYLTQAEYDILAKVLEAGAEDNEEVEVSIDSSATDSSYDEYEYDY
jgi:hypothetical protein